MKPIFKPTAMFFLGLLIGLVASVIIVEKQLWLWRVVKDRDVLIMEVRKINLKGQELDDLERSIKAFMDEIERAWATKEEE